MNFSYIDIHSHLNFSQFDEDREAIIAEMKERGIATICVGTDAKTSAESVELANKHDNIYATIGVHPTHLEEGERGKEQGKVGSFDEAYYESLLGPKAGPERSQRVVAVGECGLDYFRMQIGADMTQTNADKERQKELFIRQIAFASKHSLPLMIHGRPSRGTMDAYDDIHEILIAHCQLPIAFPGNMHFFVGDVLTATKFLDLGFTLSFDGPVTFTSDYDETIRFVPSDMIMVETDAPFAAPAPHRGKRNSPLFVPFISDRLADIRGVDRSVFRNQTIENARRVFGIISSGKDVRKSGSNLE